MTTAKTPILQRRRKIIIIINLTKIKTKKKRESKVIKKFDLIVRKFCHRKMALIHRPWLIHEIHTALYLYLVYKLF